MARSIAARSSPASTHPAPSSDPFAHNFSSPAPARSRLSEFTPSSLANDNPLPASAALPPSSPPPLASGPMMAMEDDLPALLRPPSAPSSKDPHTQYGASSSTRKIVLKRPASNGSGSSGSNSGGPNRREIGGDAQGETEEREHDGDDDQHLSQTLMDEGMDVVLEQGPSSSSGESEIEVQARPVEAPARKSRRSKSQAYDDDDDDDEDENDFEVQTNHQVSPRMSRSGRLSKPPAYLKGAVTDMNFTDEEAEEEPKPSRGRNARKQSSEFISKNEDFPDFMEEDDDGNPLANGRSLRTRRSSTSTNKANTAGGFRPSNGATRSSTRARVPPHSLRAQAPAKHQTAVPKGIINGRRNGLRSTGPAVDPDMLRLADQELPPGFDGSDGVLGAGTDGEQAQSAIVLGEGEYEDGDEEFVHVETVESEEEEDEDEEDDHPVRAPGKRSSTSRSALARPGRLTRNSSRHVVFSDEDESSSQRPQRSLRERKNRPNYQLIPAEGSGSRTSPRKKKSSASSYGTVVGGGKSSGGGYNRIPWGVSGKELGKYMGLQDPNDSSDDEFAADKSAAASAGAGSAGMLGGAGGGLFNSGMPMDMAGGPSNLGKVGDAALSDADPLGVNTKVTFEDVGGLDQHIQQLKEMVSLPLLYPEVFQQFNVTPPRGVLFHGPPGTGKTLVARALAASCSSTGTKISFFMRKGADCLSKWVGEAERQLRLLFEEAKKCQPSIIFFDEIDGLAPVRSSKQDQIHASIVSTLLALMDGMDGRGQVIIIGATNRPDAVDPALRRPGRFDREFFFPLPNKLARRKILEINTKTWEPALGPALLDNLADVTKGYGGADLRALCTEASLNAIQRRYPQIYKTNERLLLQPESIHVQAKDFMVSVKNLIPSSARSTASAAAPLPTHLFPLLSDALKVTTTAIDRVLPPVKKRSVLEDAEWENDDPAEGSYEKELKLQEFEASRVYRPRLIIHGGEGLGQPYIAAAVLHHLEGFHVQSMDLATLLGDSTRTLEAAIVQLFIEAKRHKPAVLFIPSLNHWVNTITETARNTFKSLLDSLSPSDPVILLAVIDGDANAIPRDVKAWFGHSKENRVALSPPTQSQRADFFSSVLLLVRTPPSELPDAAPKRRRILEELPIAPPPPPRQPTPAELAAQAEDDRRLREHLKWRLGPVVNELKRKHKRFTKPMEEEFEMYMEYRKEVLEDHEAAAKSHDPIAISDDDEHSAYAPNKDPLRPIPPIPNNIDLEKIHSRLYYDRYLSVEDFLAEIHLFLENAHLDSGHTERVLKSQQLVNHAQLLVEQSCDAQFRLECRRMAEREKDRRKAAREEEEQSSRKGKERESSPKGSRFSHRVRGVPADVFAPSLENPESSLKRSRGVSVDVSNSGSAPINVYADDMDLDVPPSKKSRPDGDEPATTITANGLHSADSLESNTSLLVVESPQKPDVEMVTSTQTTPKPSHGRSLSLQDLCSPSNEADPSNPSVAANGLPTTIKLSTPRSSRIADGVPASVESLKPDPQSPTATLHAPFVIGVPSSPAAGDLSIDIISPAHAAAPEVVLPPPVFFFPEADLVSLESVIASKTSSFNVEQLEQLRATLSDAIWKRRADWDRSLLVDELTTAFVSFLNGVEGDDFDW